MTDKSFYTIETIQKIYFNGTPSDVERLNVAIKDAGYTTLVPFGKSFIYVYTDYKDGVDDIVYKFLEDIGS